MIFFICGFTSAGKSTLAKELAELLTIPYFDLDNLIEQQIQMPIAKFFANSGEEAFREVEKETLLHFIKNQTNDCILALGGGTMNNIQNAKLIVSSGISIYLIRSREYFYDQIPFLIENKPLFQGLNKESAKKRIDDLLAEREEFYAISQLETLAASGFSAKKLGNLLKLLTNRSQSL